MSGDNKEGSGNRKGSKDPAKRKAITSAKMKEMSDFVKADAARREAAAAAASAPNAAVDKRHTKFPRETMADAAQKAQTGQGTFADKIKNKPPEERNR